VEIKSGRKDLLVKAVYIPNTTASWSGAYYIYYYDLFNHSFYLNDIDNFCIDTRIEVSNILENILNKAYQKEMNSFIDIMKKIQMTKKPKVYNIYKQKNWLVVIDKISILVEGDSKWRIKSFRIPKKHDRLNSTLKGLGIKKS
jgi:hypothetical protein